MEKQNLFFEVIKNSHDSKSYSDGCSGSRSDCCTRVCTRQEGNNNSTDAWENYLDINAGVLQY